MWLGDWRGRSGRCIPWTARSAFSDLRRARSSLDSFGLLTLAHACVDVGIEGQLVPRDSTHSGNLTMTRIFTGRAVRAQSGAGGDSHSRCTSATTWHPPEHANTSRCNDDDRRPTPAYVDEHGKTGRAWNGSKWLVVPREPDLPPGFAGDGRSQLCERRNSSAASPRRR